MSADDIGIGHNGGPPVTKPSVADEKLKSFVDRLANILREKAKVAKEFNDDAKEIRAEAKGNGFDVKILTKTVREKLRREAMGKDDYDEEVTMLEIYFRAAGLDL